MNRKKEIERLNGDIYLLRLLIKAYQRENNQLKQDIEVLNASLDTEHAEKERWKNLAHKIDKLRRKSVQELQESNRTLCDRVQSVCGLEETEGTGIQTEGDLQSDRADPDGIHS